MQKIYFTALCLLAALTLSCTTLFAQHRHEFSLYGGGGLSTLQYKANTGRQQNGFGGHAGMGYHFFFSRQWGVGTGVEAAFYNARYTLNDYSLRYPATDPEGAAFEFRSTVDRDEERQHAALLQIPLMLQFQTGRHHQFYAAVGGKAGLSMSANSNSTATLHNAGYYAQENYTYTTQTFMGFGTFADHRTDSDLQLSTAFFASAEAGVKWRLNNHWALYTGVYLDYGLNDVAEASAAADLPPLVAYHAQPAGFTVHSAFRAQDAASGQTLAENNITPLAAGIKLRLAFGKNCGSDNETIHSDYPATEMLFDTIAPPQTPPTVTAATPETVTDPQLPAKAEETDKAADNTAEEAADKGVNEADKAMEAIDKAPEVADHATKEVDKTPEVADSTPEITAESLQPVGGYLLSKTALTAKQQQQWNRNIAILQQHPDQKIFIYGHTCNLGSAAINERVGLQRAEAAKAYLINKGIAAGRIIGTASKRDTEPLLPNTTEANRRVNRRVEVVLK